MFSLKFCHACQRNKSPDAFRLGRRKCRECEGYDARMRKARAARGEAPPEPEAAPETAAKIKGRSAFAAVASLGGAIAKASRRFIRPALAIGKTAAGPGAPRVARVRNPNRRAGKTYCVRGLRP